MRAAVSCIILIGICFATVHAQGGSGAFSFALIADMPYNSYERSAVADIMREIDAEALAFVIHAGDLKSGSDQCDDGVLLWNRALFDRSRHPLIYVPGDNDWTDCHRESNGGHDPEERLQKLRNTFYTSDNGLGRRSIRLTRQSDDARYSDYRENVRWQQGAVLFVALHIVGSNNNWGRSAATDAEYRRRNAADIAWLEESFRLASQRLARAVVVVIHANPLFEVPATDRARRGYNDFLDHLYAETVAFGKPVLLLHGDTHHQRVDHPLTDRSTGREIENFTRAEAFGSPWIGWVKINVNPSSLEVFSFEPRRYSSPLPKPAD